MIGRRVPVVVDDWRRRRKGNSEWEERRNEVRLANEMQVLFSPRFQVVFYMKSKWNMFFFCFVIIEYFFLSTFFCLSRE